MADPRKRRSENATGNLFVDSTCIDCETCRLIAPEVFRASGAQSAVHHQPATDGELARAYQALTACPVGSIGTVARDSARVRSAALEFPIQVEDEVFYCGYHSERSFGAASYLIRRKDGNVLVDSPRFARPLVRRLEELGGVAMMFLTHRDDVADHELFRNHFGLSRILHEDDVTRETAGVERRIRGSAAESLAGDLSAIPVPGHTRGHAVLLYRNKFLFSGDHLAWSPERRALRAFRNACWYSWSEQIESMKKLRACDFEWVLPGHGARHYAAASVMHEALEECIAWMERR